MATALSCTSKCDCYRCEENRKYELEREKEQALWWLSQYVTKKSKIVMLVTEKPTKLVIGEREYDWRRISFLCLSPNGEPNGDPVNLDSAIAAVFGFAFKNNPTKRGMKLYRDDVTPHVPNVDFNPWPLLITSALSEKLFGNEHTIPVYMSWT